MRINKQKSTRIIPILLVVAVLVSIVGIVYFGYLTTTEKPTNEFKQQLQIFFEKADKVSGMIGESITCSNYEKPALQSVIEAHDILSSLWPRNYAKDEKRTFILARKGWGHAQGICALYAEGYNQPAEPHLNGYDIYIDYMGDSAILSVYQDNHPFAGRKYMDFSENFIVLLIKANEYYQYGKESILLKIP